MNPQTTQTAQEKAQELLALEQELVLSSFSNEDALTIGLQAVAYIHEAKKSGVYIEIRCGENIVFSHCMDGANWDNRLFAQRKLNTVTKFEHCSMYAGEKYITKGRQFYDYYAPQEYQCAGGGFPIVIPGTGMVGMIGVSGSFRSRRPRSMCRGSQTFSEKSIRRH